MPVQIFEGDIIPRLWSVWTDFAASTNKFDILGNFFTLQLLIDQFHLKIVKRKGLGDLILNTINSQTKYNQSCS